MKKDELNRRDFTSLTMAAFGGMVAGSMVGCGDSDTETADDAPVDGDDAAGGDDAQPADDSGDDAGEQVAANDWKDDIHVCHGLNACKGKGVGKDNACAGQGTCSTTPNTPHTCHYKNDCKYQGGCGESVGNNACKEKGECGVPLSSGTWKKARASFEAAMAKAEQKFGDAPVKAKKKDDDAADDSADS
jgi:hypothetical protein